jgi:hypothetical protein
MSLSRKHRLSLVALAFWAWFLASVAFYRSHPWVDAVFLYIWLVIMVIAGVYSVREMFRRSERTGDYVFYRGVPRFLRWIFESDESPRGQR